MATVLLDNIYIREFCIIHKSLEEVLLLVLVTKVDLRTDSQIESFRFSTTGAVIMKMSIFFLTSVLGNGRNQSDFQQDNFIPFFAFILDVFFFFAIRTLSTFFFPSLSIFIFILTLCLLYFTR